MDPHPPTHEAVGKATRVHWFIVPMRQAPRKAGTCPKSPRGLVAQPGLPSLLLLPREPLPLNRSQDPAQPYLAPLGWLDAEEA